MNARNPAPESLLVAGCLASLVAAAAPGAQPDTHDRALAALRALVAAQPGYIPKQLGTHSAARILPCRVLSRTAARANPGNCLGRSATHSHIDERLEHDERGKQHARRQYV